MGLWMLVIRVVVVCLVVVAGCSSPAATCEDTCDSGVCVDRVCADPTCTDATRNGDESDVDCGGPCGACADGRSCNAAGDCESAVCSGGVCQPASCDDGVRNGAESDADCGGAGCAPCAMGKQCGVAGDCDSGVCTQGICRMAACGDLVKNGAETDTDCGGPDCGDCGDGETCGVAGDCVSQVCSGTVCQPPSCTDAVKNGAETDVNCGGGTCAPCGDGLACAAGTDCTSKVCAGDACQPPSCTDTEQNGAETDLNCGGGTCAGCALAQTCVVGADCASGVCREDVCVAPSCDDDIANGAETDADCGGGTCDACRSGKACLVAEDCASEVCIDFICNPDPALLAPPLDRTVPTGSLARTDFLYNGPNALQTGVIPGAIDERRVTILQGVVLDAAGTPLSDVEITVLGAPELGHVASRADGRYDIAVNGGTRITLSFARAGLLPSQRSLEVAWKQYAEVDPVALIPLDPVVTPVMSSPSAPAQVALSTPVTDADGTRQAKLFFEAGTEATMIVDGSSQPLTGLAVRATEYTVGPNGRAAMPGSLPPTSGYTYAVELSVDEALEAGATSVEFTKPVALYLENFLDFPVGEVVPAGYYDRARGTWVSAPNGRIIEVLGVTGGLAELDLDGTGTAADASALAASGFSDAERQFVATSYAIGTKLWRTRVAHFTPWDCNFPYGPPDDAKGPDMKPPTPKDPCEKAGSVIACERQSLGEELPVAGTPHALWYRSERVPGNIESFTLEIPLSDANPPPQVKRFELELRVAGQRFYKSYAPAPNLLESYTWDGLDAYGREVQGVQVLVGRLGYVYDAEPLKPGGTIEEAFAKASESGAVLTGDRGRTEVTLWQEFSRPLGAWDARVVGLGGWMLSAHHAYDPERRILYEANRYGRGAELISHQDKSAIRTVAGGGSPSCYAGNGGPANAAKFCAIEDIAAGPDGSLYVIDSNTVRRIRPDGVIVHFAGDTTFSKPYLDEVPAIDQPIYSPRGLAVGPDGSVYVATFACVIRKITPDGIIRTIAGVPSMCGFAGDGGDARSARLSNAMRGLAVAADGTVYFADDNRVRRISPSGIIATIAGGATAGYAGDGGPAIAAQLRFTGTIGVDVAVGPDGSVYIADNGNHRVRRIGVDGIIQTVAGDGTIGQWGQWNGVWDYQIVDGAQAAATAVAGPTSLAVTPTNELLINTRGVVRMVRNGIISRLAGRPAPTTSLANGDGDLATRAPLRATRMALGPDGAVHLTEPCDANSGCSIRSVTAPPAGLTVGSLVVPSHDGADLFVFTPEGRHLRTVDMLTGVTKYSLAYDSEQRLIEIEDRDGGVTTIERDTEGRPTAIAAASGQLTDLALDANGFLSRVEGPDGGATQLVYTPSGLLTSLTWPEGNEHTFTWDERGRLQQDNAPDGWFISLARAELLTGHRVTATNAANRATTYALERFADGAIRRTVTPPSGGAFVDHRGVDGVSTINLPDGVTVVETERGDPRFSTGATYLASQVVTTPGNRVRTYTATRTTTGFSPTESLVITNLTDSYTVNSRTATMSYDVASRTALFTMPMGTQGRLVLDPRGRVVEEQLAADTTPIAWSWTTNGKLAQRTQGTTVTTLQYDANDRISRRLDAAGNATEYTYDANDRLASVKTPAGYTWLMGHDRNGGLIRVTSPSGIVHNLGRTARRQAGSYSPPGGGSFTRTYTADGKVQQLTLPSGRTISRAYDVQGRLQSLTYPEATVTMGYVGNTTRLSSAFRSSPLGNQAFSQQYDGPLVSRYTFGASTINLGWDDNFFFTYYQLVGAPGVSLFRDNDGLLSLVGPFSFQRTGPARMQSQASATNHTASYGYDGLRRPTSKAHTFGGVVQYQATLTWSPAGKVAQKVETMEGVTSTYDYSYDADGQLVAVTKDGAAHEAYAYDMDANRVLRTAGGVVDPASYDAVTGALTAVGATAYTFNADGQLATRGADTFTYSALGELTSAMVGGTVVTYRYDGLRRRTARVANGVTTTLFYANPRNMLQLSYSHDSATGAYTAYYYDDAGRLLGFDRGGVRHHVATDPLGSPRLVADANGAVLKVIEYDAFGRLVSDSNPALVLPIGYAGNLHDPLTGLVWLGVRDYDPESGRFTARDPVFMTSDHLNLYVYASNDPVTNKDVMGLTSIGFSAMGWGLKIAMTPEGVSLCGEAGIGVGGGVSFAPHGKLDPPGLSLNLSVSGKLGLAGAELTAKIDKCGPSAEGKVTLGPLEVKSDGEFSVSEDGMELGAKAEAKASIQGCVSTAH